MLNEVATLTNPDALIYQYGGGVIYHLYEGGRCDNLAYQGDVPDLRVGTTKPGHYRTCMADGQFQLGAAPCAQITCDVGPALAATWRGVMLKAAPSITEYRVVQAGSLDYAADVRDTLHKCKAYSDAEAAEKAAFVARIEELERSLADLRTLVLSFIEKKQPAPEKPAFPANALRSPRQDVGLKTFI